MKDKFRSKEFHTLLFLVAVVLQYRVHVCWGAPVAMDSGSTVAPSAVEDKTNGTTINCTTAASIDTISSSEEQGDEFADLQELRSGLNVLNTIAVRKRAMA